MFAADIVKIDINAGFTHILKRGHQLRQHLARFVIDHCACTEFFNPCAFVCAARRANDFHALGLSNLGHGGPNCASSSGNKDHFAGLGFSNLEQTEPCGAAWHSDDA